MSCLMQQLNLTSASPQVTGRQRVCHSHVQLYLVDTNGEPFGRRKREVHSGRFWPMLGCSGPLTRQQQHLQRCAFTMISWRFAGGMAKGLQVRGGDR